MSGIAYPVPIYLPRRRRIITPGEWLRDKVEERRREKESTIAKAIAFDANLGANTANGSSLNLSTTANAASSSRLFLWIVWNGAGITLTGMSAGGGLTWSIVGQVEQTGGVPNHLGMLTASAPSGLSSGTTLTPSYSAAVTVGVIGCFSATGVLGLDTSSVTHPTGSTSWSGSVTPGGNDSLVVGACSFDCTAGGVDFNTPTAPATEVHDAFENTFAGCLATEYRIESTGGSKTIAGTWDNITGIAGDMSIIVASFLTSAAPAVAPPAHPDQVVAFQ